MTSRFNDSNFTGGGLRLYPFFFNNALTSDGGGNDLWCLKNDESKKSIAGFVPSGNCDGEIRMIFGVFCGIESEVILSKERRSFGPWQGKFGTAVDRHEMSH